MMSGTHDIFSDEKLGKRTTAAQRLLWRSIEGGFANKAETRGGDKSHDR